MKCRLQKYGRPRFNLLPGATFPTVIGWSRGETGRCPLQGNDKESCSSRSSTTRQLSLFLVGAQVKTAPLTMHLLLVFMVGTCAAMSVRKSPYVYQSNPMARMSMQARHHSGGNGWTSRSKNPFSYMVGKEFFKNENIEGDHFEGPYEDLPYSVTQVIYAM